MKNSAMAVAAAVTALAFAAPASAQQFFGEDTDGTENARSTNVNGLAQENLFLANLQGVGTETFEGFADGLAAPLILNFPGAGSATLSGGNGEVETVASGTDGFGRYGVDGTNFFETAMGGSNPFTISFVNPVAAFGFYGVDIGDFGSQLSLAFANGGGTPTNVVVPHSTSTGFSNGGSSFFFGYINVLNPFTSITFNATERTVNEDFFGYIRFFNPFTFDATEGTVNEDFFGFDRMTIGTVEQVVSVPEPGVFLLMAAGALGMMLVARRREVMFDA